MASSIQILTSIQTPLICITQTRASKIQILIPWTEPDPDPCLRPTSMPLMLVSETGGKEDSPCCTGLQPFWARGLAPPFPQLDLKTTPAGYGYRGLPFGCYFLCFHNKKSHFSSFVLVRFSVFSFTCSWEVGTLIISLFLLASGVNTTQNNLQPTPSVARMLLAQMIHGLIQCIANDASKSRVGPSVDLMIWLLRLGCQYLRI